MRSLSCLFPLALLVGTACIDLSGAGSGLRVCAADESVACGDVPRADVGGETFVDGSGTATCNAKGFWDTSTCKRIGGGLEFSFCFGVGQGDCDDGLMCVPAGSGTSQCLTACADTAACGDGRICAELGQRMYCFKTATTGSACFSDETCISPGDACVVTGMSHDSDGFELDFRSCTRTCTGDQLGQSGGQAGNNCTADEICVTAIENVEGGSCVGSVLPMQSSLAAVNAMRKAVSAPNPDLSSFCFLPPGESQDDATGEVYVGNYACGIEGAVPPIARASCYRLTGRLGYCAGTCAGPDGTFLNCGTGYHCGQAAQDDSILAAGQLDANGNEVTCSGKTDTTSCDSSAGYSCVANGSFAFHCAKPAFVCIKD